VDLPNISDWPAVTGHDDPNDDPDLASAAYAQAQLVILVHAGVESWDQLPVDTGILPQIARQALFEVAEYIFDSSELRRSVSGGVASERIGSWNYTLKSDAKTLNLSEYPTGLEWLDMLLDALGFAAVSASTPWSTGIDVFESDAVLVEDGYGRQSLKTERLRHLIFDPSIWWFQ
jgi:hypothetical protein